MRAEQEFPSVAGDHPLRHEFNLESSDLSIADVVRFLERQWRIIAPSALLGLVSFLIAALWLIPASYKCSATLIVLEPSVVSELNPRVLSVHGYRTLLESDAVLLETQERLQETGAAIPDDGLKLGEDLESRIFISQRQETTSLSPMIEAAGIANDPETAAQLANTWVTVFLEMTKELTQRAMASTIDLVEEQYPQVRDDLAAREDELVLLANSYHLKIQEAATRGDQRILSFKKKTADLLASFNNESQQLLEQVAEDGVQRLRKANATESVFGDLHELEATIFKFVSTLSQIAETSQIVTLEKAITDDALWDSLIVQESEGTDLQVLENRNLLTQEVNSLFNELALQAVSLEVRLRQQAGALQPLITQLTRELNDLQRDRSAGLAKLLAAQSLEVEIVQRDLNREIAALNRERTARLGQGRREVNQLGELEGVLRKSSGQAILAKAQEGTDAVLLAAPAVPVVNPVPRRALLKALGGMVVGLALGVALATIREVHALETKVR